MPIIEQSDERIVCRKHPALQYTMFLVGIVFAGVFVVTIDDNFPPYQPVIGIHPLQTMFGTITSTMMLLFLPCMAIASLYSAGPEDLILNIKSRTYRFRTGVLFFAKWEEGTFADIECFYPYTQKYKGRTIYQLRLGWRGVGYKTPWKILGKTLATRQDIIVMTNKSKEIRDATLEELASKTGVQAWEPNNPRTLCMINLRKKALIPVIVCYCLLLSILALVPAASFLYLHAEWRKKGITVQGSVANSVSESSNRIVIRYPVEGFFLQRSVSIPPRLRKDIRPGDPVLVTYLSEYPRTIRTPYSTTERATQVSLVSSTIMILLVLFSAYWQRRKTASTSNIEEG